MNAKFTLLVLLATLFFVTAIYLLSLRVMRDFSFRTAEELAVTLLDQTDKRIDQFFGEIESLARELAGTKAVLGVDRRGMRDLFVAAVNARSRYLRAVYLGTVRGEMHEWGQGKDFVDYEPNLPPGYDPRVRPWYVAALKSEDFVVSAPYVFASTDALGITGCLKVRDGSGALVGILGLDILLEDLKQMLEDLKVPKEGRPLLLNERGEIIAGRFGAEAGSPTRLARFEAPDLAARLSRDNGTFQADLEGRDALFVYKRSAKLGWFVLVGIPRSSILVSVERLLAAFTVIDFFLMVLLALSLSFISSRVIAAPLKEIVSVINRIDRGERGARARIRSRDEFALLGGELNKLLDAVAEYSNSLEEKVRIRTEELWSLQQENTRLRIVEERQRIYRDMHDSIGARLTNVFFCNNVLRSVAERDPRKAKEMLDGIELNCLEAVKDLKEIVWGMKEEERISVDFASFTAEGIKHRLRARSIEFTHRISPRAAVNALDPRIKTELARIFDELVSNVLKHSGASKASMSLIVHDGRARIRFKDDGKGLDRGSRVPTSSGLSNIEFRVGRLGGSLEIETAAGAGTEFRIEFPSDWRPPAPADDREAAPAAGGAPRGEER